MKDAEIEEWLEISETWLENYYNEYFLSKASEAQREAAYIKVELEFVSQSVLFNRNSIPINTITYHEMITYSSREVADDFPPETLRESAFADETAVATLVRSLQESIPCMTQLESIDGKIDGNEADSLADSGLSSGTLTGIILSSVAVVIGGAAAGYAKGLFTWSTKAEF